MRFNDNVAWEPETLFYKDHVRKRDSIYSIKIVLGIAKNHFLSFTEGILGGGHSPLKIHNFSFLTTIAYEFKNCFKTFV